MKQKPSKDTLRQRQLQQRKSPVRKPAASDPSDLTARLARLEQLIDDNNRVFVSSLHTVEMWLTVIRMFEEDLMRAVSRQTVGAGVLAEFSLVRRNALGTVDGIDWDAYIQRYQEAIEPKAETKVDEPPVKEDDPTVFTFGGSP